MDFILEYPGLALGLLLAVVGVMCYFVGLAVGEHNKQPKRDYRGRFIKH